MRDFIFSVIKESGDQIGIECVIEEPTSPNTTMPNPRIEVVFMPDSLIPTGKKLSKRTEDGKQITVHERYEIDTPVILFLRDKSDERIKRLSRDLVMAFPKGVEDVYNNWVKIRASQAEWSGFKAPVVGTRRIEPIIARSYSVRVGFTWRLTYEKAVPYLQKFEFKGDFL